MDNHVDEYIYNKDKRELTLKLGDIKKDEYIMFYIEINPQKANTDFYIQAQIESKSLEAIYFTPIDKINATELNTEVSVKTNTESNIYDYTKDIEYEITVRNDSEVNIAGLKLEIELPNEFEYDVSYLDGEIWNLDEDEENSKKLYYDFNLERGEETTIKLIAYVSVDEIIKEDRNISTKIKIDRLNYSKEINYILQVNKDDLDDEDDNNNNNGNNGNNGNSGYINKKIFGTVWLDENKDGRLDNNEAKLSNIQVQAVNTSTGKVISQATTNDQGKYTLSNISKGTYTIIFEYDTNKYSLTEYSKEGVEDDCNSKVVSGNYEGKEIATTNNITIENSSIANINMGLIEKKNFDLSLNKKVKQISMANTKKIKTTKYNTQLAKIDLDYKYINNTKVAVEYEITVTNEGEIPGYASKIVDYLPEGFDFSAELNKDWYTSNKNIETRALADTVINPGESQTVTLVLTKSMNENGNGIYCNTAEIAEDYNEYGQADSDSTPGNNKEGEDDQSSANVILGLKTGGPVTYITLTLSIMALICVAAYEINKRVLKS